MSRQGVPVLQVAQAIQLCNALLKELPMDVEGEVANYSLARGQFVFFDLKDEQAEARLSCFMMMDRLAVPLENGMRVRVSGTPGLYQKSGTFRLTLSRVEPRGAGSLARAFELLRLKLEGEGLFETVRKRPLPRFVQEVGIVSSSGAAGFGDFMKIAGERLPGILFRLVDVAVQGVEAEREICEAFDRLNGSYSLDAIVLLRGGGSAEDLQAFNAEPVARAIARSKAPVLVGVGHERDVTIADMAADVRAATPSNAAQLLLPTMQEVRGLVESLLVGGRQALGHQITERRYEVKRRQEALRGAVQGQITNCRVRVHVLLTTVDAISPQSTLRRGYTLTLGPDGKPLRSAVGLTAGLRLTTRFSDGFVHSIISSDETV